LGATARTEAVPPPIEEAGLANIREAAGRLVQGPEPLRNVSPLHVGPGRRLRGRSHLHRPPGLALQIAVHLAPKPDLTDNGNAEAEQAKQGDDDPRIPGEQGATKRPLHRSSSPVVKPPEVSPRHTPLPFKEGEGQGRGFLSPRPESPKEYGEAV
jgi:hypothetical protein